MRNSECGIMIAQAISSSDFIRQDFFLLSVMPPLKGEGDRRQAAEG